MLRTLWFWIAIFLIIIGIVLTSALGVFYWLIIALIAAIFVVTSAFLIAAYAVGDAESPDVPSLQELPKSKRIPVIYDCDLTMGCPFRDVSDGLALLYLLGEPRVHVRCVTITYGNGPVKMNLKATRRLLRAVGRSDVLLVPGANSPHEEAKNNQAASFLRDMTDDRPGEVALLATGSMTNLKHAATLDPDFFKKLRSLHLMGGTISTLFWNGHRLKDRNFSLDPEAAYQAIHPDCPLELAPGQAGLTAIFRSPQFAALQEMDNPVSRFIVNEARIWFALMRLWFRDDGFALWDVVPAMAMVHPELFDFEQIYLPTTRDDLRAGRLVLDHSEYGPARLVRRVRDYDGFIETLFAAWQHLGQACES